jgi:hypothetical protein
LTQFVQKRHDKQQIKLAGPLDQDGAGGGNPPAKKQKLAPAALLQASLNAAGDAQIQAAAQLALAGQQGNGQTHAGFSGALQLSVGPVLTPH